MNKNQVHAKKIKTLMWDHVKDHPVQWKRRTYEDPARIGEGRQVKCYLLQDQRDALLKAEVKAYANMVGGEFYANGESCIVTFRFAVARTQKEISAANRAFKKTLTSKIDKARFDQIRNKLNVARNRTDPHEQTITAIEVFMLGQAAGWKCLYYGYTLEVGTKHKGVTNIRGISIDRIDSSKGYVRGNVQVISNQANVNKGTKSHKRFLAECRK